jgi:hypothetical protein
MTTAKTTAKKPIDNGDSHALSFVCWRGKAASPNLPQMRGPQARMGNGSQGCASVKGAPVVWPKVERETCA